MTKGKRRAENQGGPGKRQKTSAPLAYSKRIASAPPVIHNTRRRGRKHCVVEHREFAMTITHSGGSFSIHKDERINPGNSKLFPWLSTMAVNWELFSMDRLEVEIVPRNPATQGGSLMAFIDYDAKDVKPVDEVTFLNNDGAVSDVAWKDLSMDAIYEAMHPTGNYKYVYHEEDAGDSRLYDVGRLYIATEGLSASNTWQVFLNYRCSFYIPQKDTLPVIRGHNMQYVTGDVPIVATPTTVRLGQSVAPAIPLTISTNDADFAPSFNPDGTFTLPKGKYQVTGSSAWQNDGAGNNVIDAFFEKNGAVVDNWETILGPTGGPGSILSGLNAHVFTSDGDTDFFALGAIVNAIATLRGGTMSRLNLSRIV